MALVYAHYKKTDDCMFYVGIGKSIKRMTEKKSRNILWQNIVNKHGYYPKIIIDGISFEDAKKLEILLISKLGRIDNGTGILCNMTDGGDGNNNFSEYSINKIRHSLTGKKQTDETKLKRKETLKKVWQSEYLRNIKRQQTLELHKKGVFNSNIGRVSAKKGKAFAGDKNKISKSLKEYFKENEIYNKKHIPVIMLDLNGNEIKYYKSHHDAAFEINGLPKRIIQVCKGVHKVHKNYKWKFHE